MSQTARWIPLGFVLLAFGVYDLLAMFVLEVRGNRFGPGVALGIIFAQITLLSAWTAFGPAAILTRAVTGLLLAAFTVSALAAFAYRNTVGSEALPISLAVAAQWFVVQVPLWLLRLTIGLRLRLPAERPVESPRGESQFGLGQLLVWTMLVSLVLGLARLALPSGTSTSSLAAPKFVALIVLLSAFNSLLAWPLIWGTLAPRGWILWLALVPVCGVVLTLAEVWSFRAAVGEARFDIFCWFNASHYVAAGIALLAVRRCGFRLTRGSPDGGPAPAEPTTAA